MNCKFVVARFEDTETMKIVAFNCVGEDGGKVYFETMVPLIDCVGKTDNEVCCMAYDMMEKQILATITNPKTEPRSVLGTEFIPPSRRE